MPFLAPGELARCGLPRRRHPHRQPARGRAVDPAHRRCCPGLVGAVAYNWSHRNHGVRLFEIGHTFNRPADADAELPDERECLGAVARRARGARGRRTSGGWSPRCSACRDVRVENAELPGLHPTRAARLARRATSRSARSARSTPACWRPTASASGSPTSRSTSTRCSTCPTATAPFRPFSLFPSSDIDLAFEVDEDVPASAVEDAIRAAGGDLLWRVAPLRRLPRRGGRRRPPQPRLHPPPAGPRPHPHRRRRRRGPRADHRRRAHPAPRHPAGLRRGAPRSRRVAVTRSGQDQVDVAELVPAVAAGDGGVVAGLQQGAAGDRLHAGGGGWPRARASR